MSKPENDSTSEPISTWVEIDYAEAGRKGVELARKTLLEVGLQARKKAEADYARNLQAALADAKHQEQAKKELEASQPLKEKTIQAPKSGSDDY